MIFQHNIVRPHCPLSQYSGYNTSLFFPYMNLRICLPYTKTYPTVRTRINDPCAGSLKFRPLEKVRKISKIRSPRQEKEKTPDLIKRDNSNVLAQGLFIQVLPVFFRVIRCSRPSLNFGRLGKRGASVVAYGTHETERTDTILHSLLHPG